MDGKPPLQSSDSVSDLKVAWDLQKTDALDISQTYSNISTGSTFSTDWHRVQEERWRMDPSDFDCQWDTLKNKWDEDLLERNDSVKRVLWLNWTEEMVRDPSISPILFQYDNLSDVKSDNRLLKALYQYGLVLITGTPTQTDSLSEEFINPASLQNTNICKGSAESAILHLASIIGYHPLQTLYGPGVWSTSSHSSFYNTDDSSDTSASTADSAYGSTSLPLHTDMTYMSSPPGVQVFLMVQPATAPTADEITANIRNDNDTTFVPTGQSVYLDGLAASRQLQIENPRAFELLATTTRRYRCIDAQEGWHMEASGPVIEAIPRRKTEANDTLDQSYEWGPVKSIRHNDLDRLPDLPPYPNNGNSQESNDEFYNQLREAHEAWDNILRRDCMRLVIGLQPGDCVLVSNQRCMHGRYAFDATYYPRVVMGCYVGIDELLSKWRVNDFRVL